MSALTDLFSSFANKIRSKTGSSDTYTPTEMVDAIDDVYDAGVASVSLQASKTVTATTSSQTVEPDTGYSGLEEVVVNPQAHTTTYTPSANTAQNDMGANHDYRYVDTSGMVTPSSVTPSNSSPAALTSGSAVTPTANGYAIESYGNITPAYYPQTIPSGSIIKFNGSGRIVEDITVISPTNSTPVSMQQNGTYTVDHSSYAIQSYDTITPSNDTPVSLSSGSIYKMSGSGKAVASVTSKTPSDSSPASVSANSIIKPSSAGYLYASSGLGKCKSGTFTSSTSAQTITLGFQPKYLLVMSSALTTNIFDYSYSSTKGIYATSSAGATEYTISGNTSNNHISAISSTGFTFNKSGSSGTTIYYFAVG